ncbi:acyltransferase family protein [Nocardiopsis alba]|uniref:acyltransferase family protein n=1 Tax=Nocardiopsis alba TaxID=53437 RepID=UPI0033AC5FA5
MTSTTEPATGDVSPPTPRTRLHYVDHLRVVLTILVVLHHAAVTYGNIPVWFYTEPAQDPSGVLLDVFVIVNQTFFMGMFFLIAGYFVPGAFDRKGRRGFVRERLVRLGVPLLLFLVLLRPITMAPAYSEILQAEPDLPLWLLYLLSVDPGPLWFVEVLLVMSLVYSLVRRLRDRRSTGAEPEAVSATGAPSERGPLRWFVPVTVFAVGLGLVTFLWRWAFPAPYWPVVGLPSPGYLPQYVSLFVVGILAYRGDWARRLPGRAGPVGLVTALVALVVMAVGMAGPLDEAALTPGSWQALVQILVESFFTLGVILALLVFFRRFVNRSGRLWRFLSDNAFAVYVLHAVVLVGLGLVLSGWEAAAVTKFAALSALAVPLCWGAAALVRTIPWVRRVL